MEPSTKKRKLASLAPKVNAAPSEPAPAPAPAPAPPQPAPQPAGHPHETQPIPPQYPTETPIAERHDFESFARHLQDAAMLIQRQTDRPSYTDVSVLMLRWMDDDQVDEDLCSLENLFHAQYRFHTQRWFIPAVSSPSSKLGVQLESFLDDAKPDQLVIIYYAGRSYVAPDGDLYWASNSEEDAAELKWNDVRCLFEEARSDILLLLDTCILPTSTASNSHGVKQALAACTPDHPWESTNSRSFTSHLVEAFSRLGGGKPFSTQRLREEIIAQQQHDRRGKAPLVNGDTASQPQQQPSQSLLFTLDPAKAQSYMVLSPLVPSPDADISPRAGSDPRARASRSREDQILSPESTADLRFDEARILVCTTFVGEASPDMSYFHNWLQNTPPLGATIAVEGMFLGPPTMLLISMPHSIWNVVQHDKVCCFLGYITSHNMLHLYNKLIGPDGVKPSEKAVEDGRMLVEARERAIGSPSRTSHTAEAHEPAYPTSATRDSGATNESPMSSSSQRVKFMPHASPTRTSFAAINARPMSAKPKEENEGSAEMREAAEQLKALSHMRHRSDEGRPSATERQRTSLPNGIAQSKQNERPSQDDADSAADDSLVQGDSKTSSSRIKFPRRALPKNETRCSHCSHAPFRDTSSLRKHIAAAHTRPFPCAFAFAGCTSTFGSKNEWKRHITSQHLCLTYYRCSSCPKSQLEGKGNEFNRKDLFTQHLRRMHAPFQLKRPTAKGDAKVQAEWEVHVKGMQQSCLINRRYPPQKSACPNKDCQSVFEGKGSWDEWTEHVGRHMERGEGGKLGVDKFLVEWAVEEGIIEPKGKGGYRLTPGNGAGGGGSSSDDKDSVPVTFEIDANDSTAGEMDVDR